MGHLQISISGNENLASTIFDTKMLLYNKLLHAQNQKFEIPNGEDARTEL